MEQITIKTPSKTYPVYLGEKVIPKLGEVLQSLDPAPKNVLIITDHHVGELYLNDIQSELDEKVSYETFQIEPGDSQKSFDNYYACQSFALEIGLDRSSVILALGGGMIGDIAGFVAGTYMRGIRFIQIPTTILAHDSAVGGKTGINHPEGKNMIGVFHQPEAVIYSTDFLSTLPENEIRSGFAEVIKHALIADPSFYDYLNNNIKSLTDLKGEHLLNCLTRGIEIKNEVVSQDEREKGIRAFLNFGHTLGHAIEGERQYKGITHGEAVARGMVFALSLNKKTVQLGNDLKSWLNDLGFAPIPKNLSVPSLINRMKKDKKAAGGTINMVLLEQIGQPTITPYQANDLEKKLTQFLEEN
ncbi:3-dehydroquinate synthase [Fictibacillus phosphorivorans]|uniref:3-dehydroquinate synthase n=1 Tax=Fictibacillus phosphorivorans TaxID=1221500 RepID=UPI00203CED03|nr:3-dehydroquinate synthase [Fictibacillus phosphorivorans]MCM3719320.1 3-dehydroquinate synthase [Fictibacillus phosphorivorans]MCM3776941.1 3-dehydroquinate synthase [Fictibacillus phosphorivorans]